MERASLYVQKTCRHIEHDAKVGAPVRKPGRGQPPGGTLRASTGTDIQHRNYRVHGKVGSRLKYALVVHRGAKRHRIRPRFKKMLSFYWDKAPSHMITRHGPHRGKVMLASVNHPGMRGVHYLTVPLRYWGREMGYRVYTRE
jgi:hypothetical protein